MRTDFLKKVEMTISKYKMAEKSERLLVGLSGGADSAALLLCLKELGYNVSACHVNHCLRGEESDRDELFCVKLCESENIHIEVRSINVTEYCKANSLSTEEGARILRYKALSEIPADKICTAHNLNDCLETTIFNLSRGSGLKGLCSIPPVRDSIIRPLINCTREEIEEYLSVKGQSFITDSTNLSDDYSRNKIRHKVIPVLQDINSSLLKTYGNSLDFLREDNAYLEKLADSAFGSCKTQDGYCCQQISDLEYPIRRRVIMRVLSENSIDISSDKISETEKLLVDGGKYNIKGDTFLVVSRGYLRVLNGCDFGQFDVSEQISVPVNGVVNWFDRNFVFEVIEIDGKFENVHKMFANSCLDYDKIKGEIVLRQRIQGDKIRLVNRDFTSDVKKLLKQAFPIEKRKGAFLLADSDGIVFVEKFGAAERVKIDSSTRRVLVFKENENE